MYSRDKIYINGKWKTPAGRDNIVVVNPATEEVLATIPEGSDEDAAAAVHAARAAFDGWARTDVKERAAFLARIHQGLTARADELARVITAEVGMPLKLSRRIQVGLPVAVLESYIDLATRYPFEEEIGNSVVVREPIGVAACITPWNYPLHQVMAKVAPALAAGCTVVLKPSEVAPISAFILADIIHEAGLPQGVFNLVSGLGVPVGECLARHPEVNLVSFTGSLRAGRRVAELAAGTIKKVTLELGGKSPSVILEDADLGAAVKGTVAGCFINSGQTCNALTRMLVPESQYEQAAALAVEAAKAYLPGDPMSEQTRLGPLASASQRERVCRYIRTGTAEGARLLFGSASPPAGPGYFVSPAVFGNVTPEMTIAREEIFGPVLVILTYRDEDDAVRIANDTPYGLAAAVWSGDPVRAERVARKLQAGQVDINGGSFNLLAPFGGSKQSGYGRELGKHGLEEFLTLKSLQFRK